MARPKYASTARMDLVRTISFFTRCWLSMITAMDVQRRFCFSNRINKSVFSLFFQKSKIKSDKSMRKYLCQMMPRHITMLGKESWGQFQILLCSWHVTKIWMESLSKIKSSEKNKIVFLAVKTVSELFLEKYKTIKFLQILNDLYSENFKKMFDKISRTT